MTKASWRRVALTVWLVSAPWLLVGCGDSQPAAPSTPSTPSGGADKATTPPPAGDAEKPK